MVRKLLLFNSTRQSDPGVYPDQQPGGFGMETRFFSNQEKTSNNPPLDQKSFVDTWGDHGPLQAAFISHLF